MHPSLFPFHYYITTTRGCALNSIIYYDGDYISDGRIVISGELCSACTIAITAVDASTGSRAAAYDKQL
eukprot:scaffold63745_cov20-Prasinocladus_malaysianus.AAC.2